MAAHYDDKTVIQAEQDLAPPPVYAGNGEVVGQWRDNEDFMTRNGLNLKSFQRRPITKEVDLDKSMKTRHLHMIAIGGSIGAGFFVGSGGALFNGVGQARDAHENHAYPTTGTWMGIHRFPDHRYHDVQRRYVPQCHLLNVLENLHRHQSMLSVNSVSCSLSLVVSTFTPIASSIHPGVSPWDGTTFSNGPSSYRSN
jgi:hypothetical protein